MYRVGGSRGSVSASLRGGDDETPLLTQPDLTFEIFLAKL